MSHRSLMCVTYESHVCLTFVPGSAADVPMSYIMLQAMAGLLVCVRQCIRCIRNRKITTTAQERPAPRAPRGWCAGSGAPPPRTPRGWRTCPGGLPPSRTARGVVYVPGGAPAPPTPPPTPHPPDVHTIPVSPRGREPPWAYTPPRGLRGGGGGAETPRRWWCIFSVFCICT